MCVNLGCGLDDRFTRVDNGSIRRFNMDLPDAIEVRRKVFTDTERYKSVVGDILDPEWIKQMPETKEAIVVAEGLFMYFTREQVRAILNSLTDSFPKEYLFVELIASSQRPAYAMSKEAEGNPTASCLSISLVDVSPIVHVSNIHDQPAIVHGVD